MNFLNLNRLENFTKTTFSGIFSRHRDEVSESIREALDTIGQTRKKVAEGIKKRYGGEGIFDFLKQIQIGRSDLDHQNGELPPQIFSKFTASMIFLLFSKYEYNKATGVVRKRTTSLDNKFIKDSKKGKGANPGLEPHLQDIKIFRKSVNPKKLLSIPLDLFSKDGVSLFFGSKECENLDMGNFTRLIQILTAFCMDVLLLVKSMEKYSSFLDEESRNYLPHLSKLIGDSEKVASSTCSQIFSDISKVESPFLTYFTAEELDYLSQIFYLQGVVTTIFSDKNFLTLPNNYYTHRTVLSTCLYLFHLVNTFQSKNPKINDSQRISQYIFGYTFDKEAINTFERSDVKVYSGNIENVKPEDKKKLVSVIQAGYRYFFIGEIDSSYFDEFFDFVIENIGNTEKIHSLIVFLQAQKSTEIPLSHITFLFKNGLEKVPYISKVIGTHFSFLQELITEGYGVEMLVGLSKHDFLTLASISDKEQVKMILSGKETLLDFQFAQDMKVYLTFVLQVLPRISKSYIELEKLIQLPLSYKVLNERFLSLRSQYALLDFASVNYVKYVKNQNDKLLFQRLFSVKSIVEDEDMLEELFACRDEDKVFFLSIFKKLGNEVSIIKTFKGHFYTFLISENKVLIEEALSETSSNKDVLIWVLKSCVSSVTESDSSDAPLDDSSDVSSFDFSTIEGLNNVQVRSIGRLCGGKDTVEKKEIYKILRILSSNNSKDSFVEFVLEGEISLSGLKRIYALLVFFKSFGIKNFDKIRKLFEMCYKNEKVEERIKFLYSRILGYELDDGEEKEFKDVIMNYIKHGNQKVLDDYFFTQDELTFFETGLKSVAELKDDRVIPLSKDEFIRKIFLLGYNQKPSNSGGHLQFVKEKRHVTLSTGKKSRSGVNKCIIRQLIGYEQIKLSDWNDL